VRGNSASNIQITGNSVSNVREVALYSEFAFEGAVIANNTVDVCAVGVSVANFNEGGRMVTVHGNVIRNILPKRPIGTAPDDDAGIGIVVEADAAVTGNVIENAPSFGIMAGWGKYLRDVTITGNVVRNAFVGIGVSVVPGAGTALVSNNLISGSRGSAIVGLDHAKTVTSDLGSEGASRFPQIALASTPFADGNCVKEMAGQFRSQPARPSLRPACPEPGPGSQLLPGFERRPRLLNHLQKLRLGVIDLPAARFIKADQIVEPPLRQHPPAYHDTSPCSALPELAIWIPERTLKSTFKNHADATTDQLSDTSRDNSTCHRYMQLS
jgi:putative cofactor-binding repeat protein